MNEGRITLEVEAKNILAKSLLRDTLPLTLDEPWQQVLAHQEVDRLLDNLQNKLIAHGIKPAELLDELVAFGGTDGSAGGGSNYETANQLKRVGPNMEKLGWDWDQFMIDL